MAQASDIEQCGEWFFRVRPSRGDPSRFLAWCAKTPDLGNDPMLLAFGLTVHAEFADTPEEAMTKLKREVLN